MYSITVDKDIIVEIKEVDINSIIPHEKVLLDKKEILKNNLKYKNDDIIISTIIVCSESNLIIDGHHRYFALKELGFKKVPVTLIDYKSDSIRTGKTNPLEKKYIIDIAKSSVLLEPKSTEHAVYCNKSKNWEPIILLSSMFKIETKEIIKQTI